MAEKVQCRFCAASFSTRDAWVEHARDCKGSPRWMRGRHSQREKVWELEERAPYPPCPVCGEVPRLADGGRRKVWRCPRGCSWVSCAIGTNVPLGPLATRATHAARHRAHAAVHNLEWQGIPRRAVLQGLASKLGISAEQFHISALDEAACDLVVALCKAW